MTRLKKVSLMGALISFSTVVNGAGAFAASTDTVQTTTTNTSTTTPPAYVLPAAGSGGSAAESGRSSSNQMLMAATVGVGAAAMYSGVCATVYGSWACPLAAMAAVGASMLGSSAGGAANAGNSMAAYDPAAYQVGSTGGGYDQYGNLIPGSTGTGSGTTNGSGGVGTASDGSGARLPDGTTPQTIASAVAKINADLAKSGAVISDDGKTMTTKDGRSFDMSKGGDGPGGLAALGLTGAEANMANDLGKKYAASANAKYAAMAAKLAADGAGGGGGGGGAGRSPAADGSGGAGGRMGNFMDPRNKARAKANVSGLTRKLGDDTIGVSGDNIFEMVTRRYKARDQVNNFLKD